MEIRVIELVPRSLEAVRFTEADARDIRQWVQDRTERGTVVLSSQGDPSLYIHGYEGVEKVEVGEWILFDITDRQFRSASDGAINAFYRDVLKDDRA
jgi:hypothetical protein